VTDQTDPLALGKESAGSTPENGRRALEYESPEFECPVCWEVLLDALDAAEAEVKRLRAAAAPVWDEEAVVGAVVSVLLEHVLAPTGRLLNGEPFIDCRCGERFLGWGVGDEHVALAVLAVVRKHRPALVPIPTESGTRAAVSGEVVHPVNPEDRLFLRNYLVTISDNSDGTHEISRGDASFYADKIIEAGFARDRCGMVGGGAVTGSDREVVARTLYEHRRGVGDFPDGLTAWDDLPDSWREEWCECADAVLALLPEATTEWGVRWPWTTVIEPSAGEGSARWFAANMHTRDGVVVSRQVAEWKEAR